MNAQFNPLRPFDTWQLPFTDWIDVFFDWISGARNFFRAVRQPVDWVLETVEGTLQFLPPTLMIGLIALIAWQLVGPRLAIGSFLSLFFLGLIGAYEQAMTTLSLVLTAVAFCAAIGIPLGILTSRSDRFEQGLRPVLDTMQTTPAFVYLVPIVVLFGIGNVPGVIVTIIFAVAPLIRLTNLGIRQVPKDVIEAALAFGASRRQLLWRVQLPLATKTIMAGVNQSLMLALSMVVIASMISVGGLGQMVLRGIGRLDMGLAVIGGIGIVVLAIILDRMTQALAQSERERGGQRMIDRGPIGLVRRLTAGNGGGKPEDDGAPEGDGKPEMACAPSIQPASGKAAA
ncbi:MAG: ABC-type glycine betaine/proline uptake system permease component ProW [Saliniramus fredricksonii]|uniref:ABC-type glycine betaine/proline uptake system permease component ProW n=1 Tax=Saliniramus fredricksonii TaxID=1653334 RepID=A0A0P8A5Q9_9HYPH|nr:ABC transporter permease subunit [Saliniramus fredricksonii]KPQ10569.1 MAG: ABC-type glycine betaine/proline uptake system permease component ProW [Saliniramus fredricksonii]SCC79894.1 glycine betaine/proline transport system permease protein [Saliniramus fredricksonii]